MSLRTRLLGQFDHDDDDEEYNDGLIGLAKRALLKPIRPFISLPARRAYLTTVLIATSSLLLLALAILAYTLFYWSYIPRVGFQRTIHLQFDRVFDHAILREHQQHSSSPPRHAHPHPYGTVSLAPDLVGAQAYDITIELVLPRTRENRLAGNFMLDVGLYATDPGVPSLGAASAAGVDPHTPLARSRRPALFPYRSLALDAFCRLAELPLYLMNLRTETTVLTVPVFESVAFSSRASLRGKGGGGVPSFLHLEVQSAGSLQIEGARAHVRARFSGLRWMMYNHRILATLFGVSAFWVTEVVFAGLAWVVFSMSGEGKGDGEEGVRRGREKKEDGGDASQKVKSEGEDEDEKFVLSDTERTFPTLRGQAPLRYSSPGSDVKLEASGMAAAPVPESLIRALDADDEEDEEDMDFFDSGIGTSLESGGPGRRDSTRRRRGRMERKEDAP